MNMIPIVSRQIAYVEYDDQSSSMTVQYHTGFKASYSNVKEDDYLLIVTSTNRYDSLMRLTETRYIEGRPPAQ
ncbi:KTSC domain-containing protein [Paenibacillus sp. SYP-B3998]|uniref:KTSC domain-containing protein n=1 Tax=Paenibacillus sp. SYP-B3998 TaxID=2678564 RepID=A0A6G3ZYE3_9BACL|nr:KTSC domain-containing protein [Paenibacillus sp. SYP-B3998]NEW07233.1 KTSC domain-containing protein [Paenibacillus sp. SYP-B3998]